MSTFAHLPLFLDLRGVPVLVVGGGTVALRKLELLGAAGASLAVVAPVLEPALVAQALTHGWRLQQREFRPDDVAGQRLVIAATADPEVNENVAAAAKASGIWVNAVDQPHLGDALVPAVLARGPLTIAVGTQGVAPVLARRLRAQLETVLEPTLGILATLLARWRPRIRAALPELGRRRAFYDRVLDGEVPALLRAAAAPERVERALERALDAAVTDRPCGRVALVGAGPGDPALLTLAALRQLQRADVIVHDQLVSDAVLDLARRDAERIAVGKRGGGHSVSQLSINTLLVALAQDGRHVVRLKGGDPLTFARGGEELSVLKSHGIPFEIVPGITAAQGCAAYAGIPLTHRDHAQGVRLVTAHCQGSLDGQDWDALARGGETLVFYMGVAMAPDIEAHLLKGGRDPATPFAAIENGTRPEQRVIDGRLDQLAATLAAQQVRPPALLIVGGVTDPGLRARWFGAAVADPPRQSEQAPAAAAAAPMIAR